MTEGTVLMLCFRVTKYTVCECEPSYISKLTKDPLNMFMILNSINTTIQTNESAMIEINYVHLVKVKRFRMAGYKKMV
jgi:hypothetical protein